MKTYSVRVTQEATTYFEGYLKISATSLKNAKKLLSAMTDDEIENLVDDWEMGEGTPSGKLEFDLNDLEEED